MNDDLQNMTEAELSTLEIDLDLRNFQNDLESVRCVLERNEDAIIADVIKWNDETRSFVATKITEFCKSKGLSEEKFLEIINLLNSMLSPSLTVFGCFSVSKNTRTRRIREAIISAKSCLKSIYSSELSKLNLSARIETEGEIISALIFEDAPIQLQRLSDMLMSDQILDQLREVEQKHASRELLCK